ncbi:MAG: hypothetical protein LBR00_04805 [Clostridiales Family XIII bacterium]|jgi:thiamine monophosphate kinase|nr:hypothetical protein [Clostridiales Family XIII bacterium]
MNDYNLKTTDGRPVTDELIEELSARCEKGWDPSEVVVVSTKHGKAMAALQALDIPLQEIEALERRAKHEHKPLSSYVRSVLLSELAG